MKDREWCEIIENEIKRLNEQVKKLNEQVKRLESGSGCGCRKNQPKIA
jgi:chaperonin cofactor prefoldin